MVVWVVVVVEVVDEVVCVGVVVEVEDEVMLEVEGVTEE